ncbi:hypothetical protein, partial [Streptomyces nanshensis]|uniref:hypothetical protein n=1 Tax=Streptomyces nanshensis TaxID=518642 RepID=UPI001C0CD3E6
ALGDVRDPDEIRVQSHQAHIRQSPAKADAQPVGGIDGTGAVAGHRQELSAPVGSEQPVEFIEDDADVQVALSRDPFDDEQKLVVH